MADIDGVGQIAFYQQVVLAGGRVDLRHLFDIGDRGVGHRVGLAELAFDHDKDGLHRTLPRWGRITRRSGLGGNLRRAPQKGREIVSEPDDAMLGLALPGLRSATRLCSRAREYGHVVLGSRAARFGGYSALGPARTPLF